MSRNTSSRTRTGSTSYHVEFQESELGKRRCHVRKRPVQDGKVEWIITKVVEEFNSLDIAYIARQEDATTTLAVFVQAVDLFDKHIEPGRTLFIKFRNESGFSFRIANGQRWACNGRLTLDELTSHLGEF